MSPLNIKHKEIFQDKLCEVPLRSFWKDSGGGIEITFYLCCQKLSWPELLGYCEFSRLFGHVPEAFSPDVTS
ncbi:hypothetical protein, partial [Pseudomonas lurida]|uniref:hypothetical protein n=1 Tax=Pseudomonas lurida TaxID=244566 RepID=UPI0034D97A0E